MNPTASPTAELRQFLRGHTGMLVFLAGLALYLPCAGSYGLWDPWETHYGEVARQMTTRNDFISLWWPGSPRETPVFQTKPVFTFWLMSVALRVAGLGLPGGPPGEMALGTQAEWALRAPFCVMGALGLWAIYFLTARLAGRRAGLVAAFVAGTMPMYALIARQAMTDMPFTSLMTWALALAILAIEEPEPEPVSGRTRAAVVALLLATTVPQLLIDSTALHVLVPWGGQRVAMYGLVAMVPYWLLLAGVLVFLLRTRRRDVLFLAAAGTVSGLAVLAKGLAGLALPVLILLAHVVVQGRWRRLVNRSFLIGIGVALLIAVVVAVPWHHAMYIRHGAPWWNELYGDNHWRRMMIGRHGDRGTFVYFLRQLGHGAWPVLALGLAAVMRIVTVRPDEHHGDGDRIARDRSANSRTCAVLGVIWFVTAYAVVSLSMTKFHHYLLPALPGLAIAIGCAFADWSQPEESKPTAAPLQLSPKTAVLIGLPLLAATSFDFLTDAPAAARFLWLFSYDYVFRATGRPWPTALDFRFGLAALAVGVALALLAFASPRTRRAGLVAWGLTAVASTLFLLDHFMPTVAPYWSQKPLIARYYQERRGPEEGLIAYQLFWRGETFYTKNAINEGPPADRTLFDYYPDTDARLRTWLSTRRGRSHYFLYEESWEARLRSLLPPDAAATFVILDRRNNKFVLARADL